MVMSSLVTVFYGVLLLVYAFATAFIVYHFVQYSLNKSRAGVIIMAFIMGTLLLVGANWISYQALPIEDLLGQPVGNSSFGS